MDIANQLQEVLLFFTYDGFVAILEKAAGSVMTQVEGNGISR